MSDKVIKGTVFKAPKNKAGWVAYHTHSNRKLKDKEFSEFLDAQEDDRKKGQNG